MRINLEFFRLSWDQFIYNLNTTENDFTSSPNIKFPKSIIAAEKLVVTLRVSLQQFNFIINYQ